MRAWLVPLLDIWSTAYIRYAPWPVQLRVQLPDQEQLNVLLLAQTPQYWLVLCQVIATIDVAVMASNLKNIVFRDTEGGWWGGEDGEEGRMVRRGGW